MLDIKYIRENKETVKKNCELRNIRCDIERLLELDEKRRKMIGEIGELKEKKNELNINRHCISRNLRGIFENAGKFTFNYV